MNDRDFLIDLYMLYGNLLTDNEKKYFEYYYFEDYSLTEISQINDVSKTYSSKIINNVNSKLIEFENKLNIYKNNKTIKELLNKPFNEKNIDVIKELL